MTPALQTSQAHLHQFDFVSEMTSLSTIVVLACVASLGTANVLPAYSVYQEALGYLDMMSTNEMIDMLSGMVEKRLREEASKEAADVYNKISTPATRGK